MNGKLNIQGDILRKKTLFIKHLRDDGSYTQSQEKKLRKRGICFRRRSLFLSLFLKETIKVFLVEVVFVYITVKTIAERTVVFQVVPTDVL